MQTPTAAIEKRNSKFENPPWLVVETRDVDSTDHYLRWLERHGLAFLTLRAGAPRPAGWRACAGLLLSGGGDVVPAEYGATPEPESGHFWPERDALEKELIADFMTLRRPVVGICRGIQILNVALGGRLIQHVPRWLERRGQAEWHGELPNGDDARHGIRLMAGTSLAEALGGGKATVNSCHHQAVDPDAIGRGLKVAAWSEGGVVEALEGDGLPAPVYAVQWHPERLEAGNPAADGLIRWMRT